MAGQKLAENVRDKKGKVILTKNTVLDEKNLQILQNAFSQKKLTTLTLPSATTELYSLKIKSPSDEDKTIKVIGIGEEISEEKTYFDLADLICTVAFYFNLSHGLGKTEKEEDKDNLENQTIRRIGDLLYNRLDV